MSAPRRFENVVFAGGGCRCFWQIGFWESAAAPLGLAPSRVAAVSAGSAMACAALAGRGREALRRFVDAARRNPGNFHARKLVRGEPPFPHGRMYRDAVLGVVDDGVLARLHSGPDVRILVARLPPRLPVAAALVGGLLAYRFDRHVRGRLHPTLARRLGFRPEIVSVRSCTSSEELAELVLASSCTPPVTPLLEFRGALAVDGGVLDNVPVEALGDAPGETLVLLTRRYARLPSIAGRTYVQPSRPLPISAWDYANPAGLLAAFEQGRADGVRFVGSFRGSAAA